MKDYILTIGSSMLDIIGITPNCDSMKGCHPGTVKITFGGVGRNIVENLLRIKVPTQFISVFGEDSLGQEMKQELLHLGCDLTHSMIVNHHSSAFMAMMNQNQEIVSSIADSEIMKYLTLDYLKTKETVIKDAQYVVFASNDYDLFGQFISHYKDIKMIVDPVSSLKAKQIKHLLPYFHTIKPNQEEAEVLCGFPLKTNQDIQKAGNYFIALGIKNVFITLGSEGLYYTNGIEKGLLKVENVDIKNTIGAGDAFVAGICFGYLNQLSLKETAQFAYSMSLISCSSENAVSKDLNLDVVRTILDDIF